MPQILSQAPTQKQIIALGQAEMRKRIAAQLMQQQQAQQAKAIQAAQAQAAMQEQAQLLAQQQYEEEQRRRAALEASMAPSLPQQRGV